MPKQAGTIELFGKNIDKLSVEERRALEQRLGVLFQFGALISSLSVKENVQLMMREHLHLSEQLLEEVAMLKLDMVGLPPDAADKSPSELSGGMIKRAALARALALDPEVLILDEPTSGLDPVGAGDFDDLIVTLRNALGLTVFMVTHDLDSLHTICDRIAAISEGRIIATGNMETMLNIERSVAARLFSRQASARGRRGSGSVLRQATHARRAGKISWLRRLPQKQSGRKGTTFPPALRT